VFVLIVGGGRVGAGLAKELASRGHPVRIVEKRDARCEELRDQGLDAICGDGNDPAVLREAGAAEAQVVAATAEDEDNLVVGLLSRFELGVPRVIGRVNNPKNAWLFTPDLGVDAALEPGRVVVRLFVDEVLRS
jgi:trk system potassium uptake protein TrkA